MRRLLLLLAGVNGIVLIGGTIADVVFDRDFYLACSIGLVAIVTLSGLLHHALNYRPIDDNQTECETLSLVLSCSYT
jgi:hypothetical protein